MRSQEQHSLAQSIWFWCKRRGLIQALSHSRAKGLWYQWSVRLPRLHLLNACSLLLACRWVGILAFGEGWHNNHHAFEFSARHGLEWWQVCAGDVGKYRDP